MKTTQPAAGVVEDEPVRTPDPGIDGRDARDGHDGHPPDGPDGRDVRDGAERAAPASAAHGAQSQIRGSALLLAGTVLQSAADFIAQIILVRYLAKDQFGAWSYALALVVLFAGFAQFEMRNAASRFIPMYLERRQSSKVLGVVAVTLGVALGLGLLAAAAIVLGVGVGGFRPTSDPLALHVLLLVAALVPIQAVDTVFTGLFAAFGASRTIFVRQSIVAPVLRLTVVLALVLVNADVSFLAVGYVLATLAGVLLYVAALVRVLRQHDLLTTLVRRRLSFPVAQVLTFAGPMLTSTLVWMLMESSDAVILGFFFGPSQVADFRVVLPLARMNGIVSAVFSVLYVPIAARAFERRELGEMRDAYWRNALWMTVLTLPIMLATTAFASTVTVGFYGAAYAASAPILALLAGGYFFNTVLGFNGLTVKVHGRLRYTVVIDMVAAISNVAINLVLIPRLGPIGAAIGTASTLVLHNVLKHLALARLTNVPAFDRRYASIYARLIGIVVLAFVAAALLPHNLIVAAVVCAVAGLLGLVVSRSRIEIQEYFPELLRVPGLGWLGTTDPHRDRARRPGPPDAVP